MLAVNRRPQVILLLFVLGLMLLAFSASHFLLACRDVSAATDASCDGDSTMVGGEITQDTVWTAACSPYIVTDTLTVAKGEAHY